MLLSFRLFGICIYDTKTWHSIIYGWSQLGKAVPMQCCFSSILKKTSEGQKNSEEKYGIKVCYEARSAWVQLIGFGEHDLK